MAIIHQAELTPTKAELVARWLPHQAWFAGPAATARPVAAYRFDDPDGEVGIESHLLDVDGRLVHAPLTYRGSALAGAEAYLVGTMEHSVLGTRWVYDAPGDPVYRSEVVRVIRAQGTQVRMFVETPEGPVERAPSMQVRGHGAPDGLDAEPRIEVVRFPDRDATTVPAAGTLTGTWPGQDEPVTLVRLHPRTA